MKKILLTLFIGSFLIGGNVNAQIETPSPSPGATLNQKVGLTDVTIVYSRPSVKGRKVFAADGLVSYGNLWRTGANLATKIDFSTDVTVGGKELKQGSYAILSKPGESTWEVNFYKYSGGNWGDYTSKTPDAIAMSKPTTISNKVESFTIGLDNLTASGGTLQLMWDHTLVPVQIETAVDKAVMENINRVMAGPSENDYYNAAVYYHESGKDLKKALEWIQKSNKTDSPKFWQVRREALILADLGMKKDAIAAAKQSMTLAKSAGNDEYVKMNEKSIAEWMK